MTSLLVATAIFGGMLLLAALVSYWEHQDRKPRSAEKSDHEGHTPSYSQEELSELGRYAKTQGVRLKNLQSSVIRYSAVSQGSVDLNLKKKPKRKTSKPDVSKKATD